MRQSQSQHHVKAGAALILLLSLAPALAQRPPIQWMRGGHVGGGVLPNYLPDGQSFLSAGADNTIKFWRLSDGILLHTWKAFDKNFTYPTAFDVGKGGAVMAAIGTDNDGPKLRIYNVTDGSLRASYPLGSVSRTVAISPDEQTIVTGSDSAGDPVRLYSVNGGIVTAMSYSDDPTPISSVGAVFAPNGGGIALNRYTQDAAVFPAVGSLSKNTIVTSFGFTTAGNSNRYSPDGRFLAVLNGLTRVLDTSKNCQVPALPAPPTCSATPVVFFSGSGFGASVAFSPDSSRMAHNPFALGGLSVYGTATSGTWPLLWSQPILTIDGGVNVAFSADGNTVAGAGTGIGQWRASDGQFLGDLTAHRGAVNSAAWSRDGQFVATGTGSDSTIEAAARVWNAATGALIRTFNVTQSGASNVNGLAFSADGQVLAVSYHSGTVNSLDFYRISDGALLAQVPGGGDVTLSPDGTLMGALVSNGSVGLLRWYRMLDYSVAGGVSGTFNYVGVAFSPDGQSIFASGRDSFSQVPAAFKYQVSNGALVKTFNPVPVAPLMKIAIAPDGQTLLAANGDATFSTALPDIYKFRIADGGQTATWTGNTYGVRGLAYSPDGSIVAAGGDDGVLNFYRANDGAIQTTFREETGTAPPVSGQNYINLTSLSWSPDGTRIFYGRHDATAVMMVSPVPVLSGISIPSPLVSGVAATGSIAVTQPAFPDGFTVGLSSSTAKLPVPGSAVVVAGAKSGTFSLTPAAVFVPTPATVTATAGSLSKTATVTINPSGPLWLSTMGVAPAAVIGGSPATGTVTLNVAAPAGGSTLTLGSTNAAVTVPPTVFVPAGSFSATFPVTTTAVAARVTANLTAAFRGGTLAARLTISPPSFTAAILSPTTVTGGKTTSANQVRLNGPAPAGGIVVNLASSAPLVAAVPATVTVPEGATSATFIVTTTYVAAVTPVTITATYNGITKSPILTVNPLTVAAVTIAAPSVAGGTTLLGNRVVLNGPAPSSGAVVTLSSSKTSAAVVPASVTVPAGATSVGFGIRTFAVGTATAVSISATYGSHSVSGNLTVTP